MEKVLFLGSYGFYNFGDELCLLESMRMYPHAQHWVHSVDPAYTSRCTGVTNFIHRRVEIQSLRPDVVVVGGGGVGFLPSIRDHLHWARDAVAKGAALRIHNIGVAKTTIQDKSWLVADIVELINNAQEFSVRDQQSWEIAKQWTGREPSITKYPEVNMDMPYFDALNRLPHDRKLLGISVTNQNLTRESLQRSGAVMIEALKPYQDHLVIPVVSCLHKDTQEEDDIEGFQFFRSLFLKEFDVMEDIFLDTDYIRSFYTPQFIRALVGKLNVLFSQRKHNCIHAIGAGTPVVGFSSVVDDSIKRVFDECSLRLPRGSNLLQL